MITYSNKSKNMTLGGEADISTEEVQSEVLKLPEISNKSKKVKSDFPINAIPETMRKILLEFHKVSQLPLDYFGLTLITICGGIMGNKFKLKYKYLCPPLLYSALVGNSSSGKTPVIKILLGVLFELEEEYDCLYREELKQYEQDLENYKKGDEKPAKPIRKEIVINNATAEAIVQVLYTNSVGLISFQDELLGWLDSMNQYRSGSDEQFWLSIWSNGLIKSNRATKETIIINHAFINIIGGIQPDLLSNIAAGDKNSSGFWFRILFAFPKNIKTEYENDLEVSEETNQLYKDLIRKLIDWRNDEQKTLKLSSDSKKAYKKWKRKNTDAINETDNNAIKSILGKLADYCLRFSLILEVLDCLSIEDTVDDNHEVSLKNMKSAIQLTKYFKKTSLRVLDIINNTDPLSELSVNQKQTYNFLPEVFQTGQGVKIVAKIMKERTFKRFLNNTNLFKKLSRGYYEKMH